MGSTHTLKKCYVGFLGRRVLRVDGGLRQITATKCSGRPFWSPIAPACRGSKCDTLTTYSSCILKIAVIIKQLNPSTILLRLNTSHKFSCEICLDAIMIITLKGGLCKVLRLSNNSEHTVWFPCRRSHLKHLGPPQGEREVQVIPWIEKI